MARQAGATFMQRVGQLLLNLPFAAYLLADPWLDRLPGSRGLLEKANDLSTSIQLHLDRRHFSRRLAERMAAIIRDHSSARVFIAEGIPGAGKSTLCQNLEAAFDKKLVYSFDENSVLLGWIHEWVVDDITR